MLVLAPLLLASASPLQDDIARSKNVLVVVADDLGVDMVGAYEEGALPASTPTIDILARNGVMFRNVWANPVCSPTRAHFLTGRYGFRTGIGMAISDHGIALDPSEVILPEVLDLFPHLGRSHAAFGKWHLGNLSTGGNLSPNLAGFDHYAGYPNNLKPPLSYFAWPHVVDGVETIEREYITTVTVDDFLDWQRRTPEPWVAYVAFHAPHEPFHAPPEHLHSVDLPDVDPRLEPVPFYRAAVEAMDAEIARMLLGLGPKLWRTNIVFVADNGTPKEVSVAPFEPDHAKLTPYEGGVNVPLIVFGPTVREPGREVDALLGTTDVFATVLELAGVDLDQARQSLPTIDSVSALPYLLNPAQPPLRESLLAELFLPNGFDEKDTDVRAIRNERYKLIRRQAVGKFEFYDLESDPFEKTNLLKASLSPDALRNLLELRVELEEILGS